MLLLILLDRGVECGLRSEFFSCGRHVDEDLVCVCVCVSFFWGGGVRDLIIIKSYQHLFKYCLNKRRHQMLFPSPH